MVKKNTSKQPAAFDNSWLGIHGVLSATLQEIDDPVDPPRWKTIGACADTPNALAKELAKKKYKSKSIWIRDGLGYRRYHPRLCELA